MKKILNVLIVEDEPLIKIFLKRVVKSLGHHIVGSVSNGKEALKIINNNSIDFIFMDINIEGSIDGISLVNKIDNSEIIIYFVSAYSDKKTIEEALDTKAYSYIIKPIKEEDIFIALQVALKKKNILKETPYVLLSKNLFYSKKDKELFQDNKILKLTKTEKKIVDLFVKNIERNVTVQEFEQIVWENREVSNSTIRSAIFALRKKVLLLNIETNVGRGYILLREKFDD